MSEEELISEFGEDGWYQLEDEIYNRYRFTPMKVEIEEHHVGVNAAPLYRQEQEFQRMGLNIDRADMAHWTILCAERYLSILYDYLHEKMYDYHVLQADETPVLVSKENRTNRQSVHSVSERKTGL